MTKKKTIKKEIQEQLVELNDGLKLNKEQLLMLKLSHIESKFIEKEIESKVRQIEILEREKALCNLQASDLKAKLTMKTREHKELIADLGRKLGVDLKNTTINQETGEIILI